MKAVKIVVFIAVAFVWQCSWGMTGSSSFKDSVSAENQQIDHSKFGMLLKKYVSASGNVDYAAFKKDIKQLDAYLKQLSANVPQKNASKNVRLAYWMNAYNAFTIKLILNKYPVNSIKDISGKPWGIKFIQLGGKTYDLNTIEHEILRKMGDPRIHVGINCASVSCPKLLNRAFHPESVDKDLDLLAREFLRDKSKNQIRPDEIKISKIFSWFKNDFTQNGGLIDWINKYSEVKVKTNAKINYLEYDWNLNK